MRTLRFLLKPLPLHKKVTFISLFAVITVLLVIVAFRQLGTWLVVSSPIPEHLDIVCTFAGENVRVEYSKQLIEQNSTTYWFLSDYKDGHGRILQKNNFDMSRVLITDTCKSTISEITTFASRIETFRRQRDRKNETGVLHIALVSSPYHMRRIRIMAHRRFKTDRIKLYFLPVPFEYYPWNYTTLRYWWRSKTVYRYTIQELLKLGYFFLTGYF